MNVLVYVENWEGKFKKASYEAVAYGRKLAEMTGGKAIALCINASDEVAQLAQYGAAKILTVSGEAYSSFNNHLWAHTLQKAAEAEGAQYMVISGSFNGKMIAPLVAVKSGLSLITNVIALPTAVAPVVVKRSAFSSKGFVEYQSKTQGAIISFIPNAVGISEGAAAGELATFDAGSPDQLPAVEVKEVDRVKGKIPLPEAELVVSAGRGLKAPENWAMIEELAELLGASTACSKPVSDMHWRPHSEHVGQTGIAINPNLYIAIGISGAIQHLAGVSASKTIVVINSDPEAPFFKAADYGICGDAFDIVPKLIEAVKAHKASA